MTSAYRIESAPSSADLHPESGYKAPDRVEIVNPHWVDPADVKCAHVLHKILHGITVDSREIDALPASPIDWGGLARVLVREADLDSRQKQMNRWCENQQPDKIEAIGRALEAAAKSPEGHGSISDGPAFDLGLLDTATFFKKTFTIEFLVKGILAKNENCVLGGPQKTLKTSILIDLAISLGSGTSFLGHFKVPRLVNVGLISGESGPAVIQANAKKICDERGLPYDQAANVHWGFTTPKLSVPEHLNELRKQIGDRGLEVVLLDPLYLMLATGAASIDPRDMFQMGPALSEISSACIEAGATPVLCHHFVKRRENQYGEPEMEDLAFAGIGQHMRQWILLNRRQSYDAENGRHAMHFKYGGSIGFGGYLHLDIETGRIDEELQGRRWSVTVLNQSESIAARQDQSKQQRAMKKDEAERERDEQAVRKLERHASDLLLAMEKSGGSGTLTDLKSRTIPMIRSEEAKAAMFYLSDQGKVETCKVQVRSGNPNGRKTDGYRIIPPAGSQRSLEINPEQPGTTRNNPELNPEQGGSGLEPQ